MPFCFLNIFKPKGITSFDVIYRLRKHLSIKKIGHSGTLDPMAQGVMQVGVGSASRLLEYLESDKEYIADIMFGYFSNTGDSEGEIKKTNDPDFTENELQNVLKSFIGEISQIPPKYSAIKINGKKACDIMRKNPRAEINIKKRNVQIYNIELLEFDNNSAKIKVSCSKGTYIRTLASDIAQKLGTNAYLTALTRTRAGNFDIKNSINIEEVEIEKNGINPVDVLNLNKYELNIEEYKRIKNGASVFADTLNGSPAPIMLIYNKKLVSIGVLSDNKIKAVKVF
ncbi:MAG: tRNA pseudouridine(55) synthase TruB [Candidatus Gastranaerophilales bacterium]|nr:tRNA pseudouridine(55) synthase TruB [Candidatus Gastranaerophilales bacterium]